MIDPASRAGSRRSSPGTSRAWPLRRSSGRVRSGGSRSDRASKPCVQPRPRAGVRAVGAGHADGVRRGPAEPGWSSSASSPATRRTARASRSSARPGSCSTVRLDEAGIDRRDVYLTNAVKHFRFRRTARANGESTRRPAPSTSRVPAVARGRARRDRPRARGLPGRHRGQGDLARRSGSPRNEEGDRGRRCAWTASGARDGPPVGHPARVQRRPRPGVCRPGRRPRGSRPGPSPERPGAHALPAACSRLLLARGLERGPVEDDPHVR